MSDNLAFAIAPTEFVAGSELLLICEQLGWEPVKVLNEGMRGFTPTLPVSVFDCVMLSDTHENGLGMLRDAIDKIHRLGQLSYAEIFERIAANRAAQA